MIRRKNRISLLLFGTALLLLFAVLFLPFAAFSTEVQRKRSGDTRAGDETFAAVLAELQEGARIRTEGGNPCTVSWEETVKENRAGETTSSVMFCLRESARRSGYAFIGSGLPGGVLLLILVLLSMAALVILVLGLRGSMDTHPLHLKKSHRGLRGLACWLLLIAFLIMPVFVFCNNLTFIRSAQLVKNGGGAPFFEARLPRIGSFLYGTEEAEPVIAYLGKLNITPLLPCWIAMGLTFVMLCGALACCTGYLGGALARGLLYLFVIILCLVVLYPYFVMLITAFRGKNEMIDMYFLNLLPTRWVWSNLRDIIKRDVLTYLGNSIFMSGGATILALLCGIPAAYAMARMRFKGRSLFLGFVIMSQMFAPVVLLVGISTLMRMLRLDNTLWGLMLFNAAFNQAFAIWLLRGTFSAISPEMEQAATIDGCNTLTALIRILLPMAAPGVVTTLIFVFINAWNEYTVATVLIRNARLRPISTGITQFSSFNMIEWNYLFAAALLATIPVVILFICIEKHLAAGLTAGGVKG